MRRLVPLLVLLLAALTGRILAQATKTDRQLLTDALATITAIRDKMPADPTALTCAPATQSVITSSAASLQATGGTGGYTWSAPGGTPSTGNSSAFSTSYGAVGPQTVTVTSGTQSMPCQVVVTSTTQDPGKLLMSSSWETATGCNGPALFDSGAWSDYGGRGACDGTVHDADVVSDVFKVGTHALRITQKPGASTSTDIYNGTDFREVRTFGSQTDVTLIAWLRYHAAWNWASADHKVFIFTASDGATPNVYINERGGADAKHARLCAYSSPVDVFFCASSPQITVGLWYRLRVHIVAGTHGKMEMWLQPDGQPETKLNLTYDAGAPQANVNDLNNGQIGGIKLDSTYNAGSTISALMYMWYDGVQVFSGLAP